MSLASNGMRVLTSDDLDLVTGGLVGIVINMGPLRIEMYPDEGFVIYSNGKPPVQLGHEPVHVPGPRPA